MREDGRLKDRKKPTDHRQGKLVKLVDCIQRLTAIQHEDNFWIFNKKIDCDEGHMNPKYADEIQDIMRELLIFDITEIGDLYLTSGGRVVLDKGCGEYFNETDKIIYTRAEITSGIPYKVFMKKMEDITK
jgi:hypothetical protein